jgi:RNA polymerase sigma factor (sigma-70 family)
MKIDPCEIELLVRIATQRTGRPVHDEDLHQEATLNVVEAFQKQIEIKYPRALQRKIVWDTVCDYWRRRRTSEDLEAVDERCFAESPRFEERLDAKRRLDLLRHALTQLDVGKRTTLDLFYMQEWSIAEIARQQKKSPSAVKMELLRTRRLLARIVGDIQ